MNDNDKVLFKRKTSAEISSLPIEDGALIYNTENGNTYMDYNGQRIQTSNMIKEEGDYATMEDVYDYGVRYETVELEVANWVLNSESGFYEYTITDENVTDKHLINGILDLANQAKMSDGYIETSNGSYKIITSTAPTEVVTMNLTIQLTVQESEEIPDEEEE